MARRATPEEILSYKPHIVMRLYDEDGHENGWIADDFCVKTQSEVDGILAALGKIWAESCVRKAREARLGAAAKP